MPSANRSAPSSVSRIVVWSTGSGKLAVGQQRGDTVDALARAHDHDDVPGLEDEGRPGGRDHLAVAQDRDDRGAGQGTGAGVTQWPRDERRTGRDGHLLGDQAGGLRPEAGELAEHERGAQDVGERLGLVVGERDVGRARVRVVDVVDDEVAPAVAVGHHPDGPAGRSNQIMTTPIPGKAVCSTRTRTMSTVSCADHRGAYWARRYGMTASSGRVGAARAAAGLVVAAALGG